MIPNVTSTDYARINSSSPFRFHCRSRGCYSGLVGGFSVMPIRIEMVGKQFGRLTVIEFGGILSKNIAAWKCKCECGNEKIIRGTDLRRGATVSCGCFGASQRGLSVLKHGEATPYKTVTQEYRTWLAIKRRTGNPKNPDFPNYGGRGIRISEEWAHSFPTFLADMGRAPVGHSIDRINSNGDYEKSNCRWATTKQQMNNKRNNVALTYKGKTQNATQWGEELGIASNTIRLRHRKGLPIEEVLSCTGLRGKKLKPRSLCSR